MADLKINFGFVKTIRAGKKAKAPNRHIPMERTITNPKKNMGRNPEIIKTVNPTITEKALKIIPLPDVVNVFITASSAEEPFWTNLR